jgi:hypothetical protein
VQHLARVFQNEAGVLAITGLKKSKHDGLPDTPGIAMKGESGAKGSEKNEREVGDCLWFL